jgi:hypothetical protein
MEHLNQTLIDALQRTTYEKVLPLMERIVKDLMPGLKAKLEHASLDNMGVSKEAIVALEFWYKQMMLPFKDHMKGKDYLPGVKVKLEAGKAMLQKEILERLYDWVSGVEGMGSIVQGNIYNMQPFEDLYESVIPLPQRSKECWAEKWQNCMDDTTQVMEDLHNILDRLIADIDTDTFVSESQNHCYDAYLALYAAINYARERVQESGGGGIGDGDGDN